MAKIKLCATCKYYDDSKPNRCWYFQFKDEEDPVIGGIVMPSVDATVMRLSACGWKNPKLWEQK